MCVPKRNVGNLWELYNELMLASKWKRMKFVGRMTEVNVRQLPSPSICVQHHMSGKRRIE